jgi:hypothetical protein
MTPPSCRRESPLGRDWRRFCPGEKNRAHKVRILLRVSAVLTMTLWVHVHVGENARHVLLASFWQGLGRL